MKNKVYIALVLFPFWSFSQSEPRMPNEPGKCYAKCLIENQYGAPVIEEKRIPVYTGNNLHSRQIERFEYLINKETETILIVKDTSFVSQFQWKYLTIRKEVLLKSGSFAEWREVVCANNVTESFINRVFIALESKGFLNDAESMTTMGAKGKAALVKYQKENFLPVGQLDIETLKSLGIEL